MASRHAGTDSSARAFERRIEELQVSHLLETCNNGILEIDSGLAAQAEVRRVQDSCEARGAEVARLQSQLEAAEQTKVRLVKHSSRADGLCLRAVLIHPQNLLPLPLDARDPSERGACHLHAEGGRGADARSAHRLDARRCFRSCSETRRGPHANLPSARGRCGRKLRRSGLPSASRKGQSRRRGVLRWS